MQLLFLFPVASPNIPFAQVGLLRMLFVSLWPLSLSLRVDFCVCSLFSLYPLSLSLSRNLLK